MATPRRAGPHLYRRAGELYRRGIVVDRTRIGAPANLLFANDELGRSRPGIARRFDEHHIEALATVFRQLKACNVSILEIQGRVARHYGTPAEQFRPAVVEICDERVQALEALRHATLEVTAA